MKKENNPSKDKPITVSAAVFYTLKGAEKVFQDLQLQRKLKGGKAAVILEKDLRGDLHLQDFGPNAGKGAKTGGAA